MQITLDFSNLNYFLTLTPGKIILWFFLNFGWIFLVVGIPSGLFWWRLFIKRRDYLLKDTKYSMLAIDIPKDNEQSLVAVEQIFNTLAGIKGSATLYEKYWKGISQLSISLEIISIEGYIQFLIRIPTKFKDLAEAAVYAQYPEAEITEVEDYIGMIPDDINKIESDFDLWASEFTLAKNTAYPIKTYKMFEHQLTGIFVDPMSSLMEVMSKIGPGEHLGLQLLITPVDDHWKHHAQEVVNELIGAEVKATKHAGDKFVETSLKGLEKFSEAIYSLWGDIKDKDEDKKLEPNLIRYLTPGQKIALEGIENKMSKICFSVSFRMYYLGHKEIFHKGRGVNAIIGAINQFNDHNLNSFKKYKRLTTHRDYFFVRQRVNRIRKKFIKYYKRRSRKGSKEFMLSTEEIATMYHFPTITVKAPLLQKVASKKAEPPFALPIESTESKKYFNPQPTQGQETEFSADKKDIKAEEEKKKYIITQTLPGYDFDNDYFEEHFGIKKEVNPKKHLGTNVEKKAEPPSNLPLAE